MFCYQTRKGKAVKWATYQGFLCALENIKQGRANVVQLREGNVVRWNSVPMQKIGGATKLNMYKHEVKKQIAQAVEG